MEQLSLFMPDDKGTTQYGVNLFYLKDRIERNERLAKRYPTTPMNDWEAIDLLSLAYSITAKKREDGTLEKTAKRQIIELYPRERQRISVAQRVHEKVANTQRVRPEAFFSALEREIRESESKRAKSERERAAGRNATWRRPELLSGLWTFTEQYEPEHAWQTSLVYALNHKTSMKYTILVFPESGIAPNLALDTKNAELLKQYDDTIRVRIYDENPRAR